MAQHDNDRSEDAVVFLDVQGYNRPDRTEDDRVTIRRVLQEIAGAVLADLEFPAGALETPSDTGDGLLFVLPGQYDRTDLLTRFLPELDRRLTRHNVANPPQRAVRVRVVIGLGVLLRDAPSLTGGGIVGSAINSAARLLDSAQLREDLARATDRSCSVMVTTAFYDSVVLAREPALAASFRRVLVRAKDGVYESWLHRPGSGPRPVTPRAGAPLELSDLAPHLFVSAFDVHVFGLYRRTVGTPPLAWQLATALLLSSGAIVHCADPYRRDEARTVLERYQGFVDNGEILFLLGGTISDIRRDYPNYLQNKARGYASSRLGEIDVLSLEGPLQESDALSRAIDLLESSPLQIKRGYSGTARFREAIRRDIRPSEEIISGARPVRKLRTLNLSLYQLLTMSYSSDGRAKRVVADKQTIEAFVDELDRLMEQQIISRQIILTAVRGHFGEILHRQQVLLTLVEARIHSLYMSATTEPHAHIEVTARRDEQSPYHYGHLRTHLRIVAAEPGIVDLSPAVVRELLEARQWPEFVGHHMSCVAEIAALRLADRSTEAGEVFRRHRRDGYFRTIALVLQREYG